MHDFDDLDELERELGATLRHTLRRVAAGITEASPYQRWSDLVPDDGWDGAEVEPRSLGAAASEGDGLPLEPTGERAWLSPTSDRRRWALAVALAAAVALVLGTAVVYGLGQHRTSPGPSGPAPYPTIGPDITTPAPITFPGDGSTSAPLLPLGEPSSPATGELVASVAIDDYGAFHLYADGRLIAFADFQVAATSDLPPYTWVERRLTPTGVERVRDELLASGLFPLEGEPPTVVDCAGYLRICVRQGDRLVSEVPGQPRGAATELILRMGDIATWMPASEWIDPDVHPMVAPRVGVCVRRYVRQVERPADLPSVLPLLPPPVVELLGRAPSREVKAVMAPLMNDPNHPGSCFDLTLTEARVLEAELLSPAAGGEHRFWGIVVPFNESFDALAPGSEGPDALFVKMHPLLPDGVPMLLP